MRPLNYTTAIEVSKTILECSQMLGESGAASVAVHYENGEPEGLSFVLKTPLGEQAFTLPVNVSGAHKRIAEMVRKDPPHVSRARLEEMTGRKHAARVAWRVARDWLEATLALVAADMAPLDELMMPYLHVLVDADGKDVTFHELYRDRGQRAIEA